MILGLQTLLYLVCSIARFGRYRASTLELQGAICQLEILRGQICICTHPTLNLCACLEPPAHA
eukprot:12407358-Karenia_brevis.AAC.1